MCVCNFSILSASAHFFPLSRCVSVVVVVSLLYLPFLYCLTVFRCFAAPCALTSHLWSTVCPVCHVILARTFVFGSLFYLFSFFLYYSVNFLVFFFVFYLNFPFHFVILLVFMMYEHRGFSPRMLVPL